MNTFTNKRNPKLEASNLRIHNSFVNDTMKQVMEFDMTNIPADSDKFAVILEPRPLPGLEYVVRNIMHFLGEEWGLCIVTSQKNRDFLYSTFRDWQTVQTRFFEQENLTREEFRNMRKSIPYWESLPGKQLLCFEADTLMCRRGIEDYLQYDYVGAPWRKSLALSDKIRVGNGGLSLRSKQTMIDMIRLGRPKVIPSEDSYFSIHLHLHQEDYNLPDLKTANTFAVETMYYPTPLGIHKPWLYLSTAEILTIYDGIKYD